MLINDTLSLNTHEMFTEMRSSIKKKSYAQRLLDSCDDLLFAWNEKSCCAMVMNWRMAHLKTSDMSCQTLVPSELQPFEVECISVSKGMSLLALFGPRGFAILELPRRWGKNGLFVDGRKTISCRVNILDTHLFDFNRALQLKQLRWHPGSTTDSHFIVLLSDNTIRLYNSYQLTSVWRVGHTPISRDCYISSCLLGEIAVDFGVAPAIHTRHNDDELSSSNSIAWPIVILRENGNVYILMSSLESDQVRLYGPITIMPEDIGNYGLDYCAILVVPSVPTSLILAESNGKLHHAILMETAEDTSSKLFDEQDLVIYQSRWVACVLETLQLELGLPSDENRQSSPILLKHDDINELRYYAYHNAGVHSVTLNYISELKHFIECGMPGEDASLVTDSVVEYIVCTRVDSSDEVNCVLGFALLQLPNNLIIFFNSGQVISLKIVTDPKCLIDTRTSRRNAEFVKELELLEGNKHFLDYIRHVLYRSHSQPILFVEPFTNASTKESYNLLQQAVNVLQSQYFNRHENAQIAFSKHMRHIRMLNEQQQNDIINFEGEREVIRDIAHKLAYRFDELSFNQEIIMKRFQEYLQQANVSLPGGFASDKIFYQSVRHLGADISKLVNMLQSLKNSSKAKLSLSQQQGDELCHRLPQKQCTAVLKNLKNMSSEVGRYKNDVTQIDVRIRRLVNNGHL